LSLKIGGFRCNSVFDVYIVHCHKFHFEVFTLLGCFAVEIGTFLPHFGAACWSHLLGSICPRIMAEQVCTWICRRCDQWLVNRKGYRD